MCPGSHAGIGEAPPGRQRRRRTSASGRFERVKARVASAVPPATERPFASPISVLPPSKPIALVFAFESAQACAPGDLIR